jgi:dihydropyrimidinase
MKILLRGGTVVTASSRSRADVLVDGEHIAAVGPPQQAPADRVIDASGCLVLPGGVDVHTHLDMPITDTIRSADDFESGTRAAACGGTTTVVDYATQSVGGSLRQALDAWMARAEGRALIDFGFHMSVADLRPDIEAEMDEMVRLGVPSFKVFMAYPGRLMLDDGRIFKVLRRTAAIGGLVCLHAENGHVIEVLVDDALRAGHRAPAYHAATRPALVEAEAVRRGIALAELAGARLYIVHLSSDLALDAVREARRRGLPVFAETCPQYLFLGDERYEAPAPEAAKYVMSPPLRPASMQAPLWRGLADGDLDVVGTDHCPFRLEDKARGVEDFSKIPNGAPGIEPRMLLMYQGVVDGRLTLERFVEVTASAPARLFGLAPRKGTVEVGADADLLVLDPAGTTAIAAAIHHMRVDYNLYEGRTLSGAIRAVLSRGEVVVEGASFTGRPGRGRFLPRRAAVS